MMQMFASSRYHSDAPQGNNGLQNLDNDKNIVLVSMVFIFHP